MIGIYKITNQINNKSYIGQSVDIERRFKAHKKTINNTKISRALNKYGVDNFKFEIICECSVEKLNELERYYICFYNTYYDGYNMNLGGQKNGYGNCVSISLEKLLEIYDLLLNSKVSQRKIANIYQIGEDTVSEINSGKTRQLPGYIYPLRSNRHNKIQFEKNVFIDERNICPKCKKERKSISGKLCLKCSNENRLKAKRPSREDLKKEIRNKTFVDIGKTYGVSDNTIRKWCKSYGLPKTRKEIIFLSDEEWKII